MRLGGRSDVWRPTVCRLVGQLGVAGWVRQTEWAASWRRIVTGARLSGGEDASEKVSGSRAV